jgi:tRNA wybutosine-synthesizing protein 4
MLRSDNYVQIGCDLRQLAAIRETLAAIVDIQSCAFLFVAEVSITYMEREAADALIKWASGLGTAEFCLLEQILPDGPEHPFAKTMLSHFDKLSTPLKSVHQYSTLDDQRQRFMARGWPEVEVWNLWQAWGDDKFLSPAQRQKLDQVEPFDEWEEFALFASHYCIVQARSHGKHNVAAYSASLASQWLSGDDKSVTETVMTYQENPGSKGQRRFGAVMEMQNRWGQTCLANVMGLGATSRLSSSDVYYRNNPPFDKEGIAPVMESGPSSRMCHTITSLGATGELLVGGRTSPGNALRDCWLFSKGENKWKRTRDLPVPLYRHSVVRLGQSSLALLIGGKTSSTTIFDGCLLFNPEKGWVSVEIRHFDRGLRTDSVVYKPVFGASLVEAWDFPTDRTDAIRRLGYIAGGISSEGVVAQQLLHWTFEMSYSQPEVSQHAMRP